jgi:hypothetical protein
MRLFELDDNIQNLMSHYKKITGAMSGDEFRKLSSQDVSIRQAARAAKMASDNAETEKLNQQTAEINKNIAARHAARVVQAPRPHAQTPQQISHRAANLVRKPTAVQIPKKIVSHAAATAPAKVSPPIPAKVASTGGGYQKTMDSITNASKFSKANEPVGDKGYQKAMASLGGATTTAASPAAESPKEYVPQKIISKEVPRDRFDFFSREGDSKRKIIAKEMANSRQEFAKRVGPNIYNDVNRVAGKLGSASLFRNVNIQDYNPDQVAASHKTTK